VNLTNDGNNCNACGHSCLGGACSASACQPLTLATLSGVLTASDIILDATDVYYRSSAGVYRINKSTLQIRIVFADRNAVPLASLGSDGTYLYVGTSQGLLHRTTKDGSSQAIYDAHDTNVSISRVAAFDGTVLFADGLNGPASVHSDGTGAADVNAGNAGVSQFAIDSSGQYFLGTDAGRRGIFGWTENLIATQGTPAAQAMAMDWGYFYWTATHVGTLPGRIGRVGRDGTGQTTLLTFPNDSPTTIIVDGANLYYALGVTNTGSIWRLPTSGGTPVNIASNVNVTSLAADATAIYWTTGPSVVRLAK
jgi:hypothetical protein